MKIWAVASLCGALGASPLMGASAQAPLLTPRDSALHALNRLAYGPRPGEVDRVAAAGVMQWIDRQLSPDKIADAALAKRERQFKILEYDTGDLAAMYVDAQRERRERQREATAAPDSMTRKPDPGGPADQRGRRFAGELQELAVVRAILSERQLYEVMVDFWINHFNVFLAKGADRFLTPSYIEATIRPRALGRFADLLVATAQSPAMLFYLDNWESVAPGSTPPQAMRLRARPLFGRAPQFGRPPLFDPGRDPMRADSQRQRALERMPKGINENYARELLELHTLGVEGGYTQQDVIDVARIFTGWSIRRPQQGGDFEFHEWAHDYGEKVLMGVTFAAGHGRDEGVRLLKLLANHPATMHHVSRQLCQRFVNDELEWRLDLHVAGVLGRPQRPRQDQDATRVRRERRPCAERRPRHDAPAGAGRGTPRRAALSPCGARWLPRTGRGVGEQRRSTRPDERRGRARRGPAARRGGEHRLDRSGQRGPRPADRRGRRAAPGRHDVR